MVLSIMSSRSRDVVRVERARSKVGGSEGVAPIALRVTMIFRPEDGNWKVVHPTRSVRQCPCFRQAR